MNKWYFDTLSFANYLINHYKERPSMPIRFKYNGKTLDMYHMGVVKSEFIIELWDREAEDLLLKQRYEEKQKQRRDKNV